ALLPGEARAARYTLVDAEPRIAATEADVLEGVDVTLSGLARFAPGDGEVGRRLAAIEADARRAQEAFDARWPERTLPPLLGCQRLLAELKPRVGSDEIALRLEHFEHELQRAIALAAEIDLEIGADDGDVVPGQQLALAARLFNGGARELHVDALQVR